MYACIDACIHILYMYELYITHKFLSIENNKHIQKCTHDTKMKIL